MMKMGRLTINRLDRLHGLLALAVYSSFDTGDILTAQPVHQPGKPEPPGDAGRPAEA
ncbi:hypothetical protein BPY_09810 [Bifidobacterium psychraerophilum]